MVFDRKDDGVVIFVFLAVAIDYPDGFCEVYGFAEGFVFDGVGDNWSVIVVVHIDLHAFYSPH